MVDPAPTPARAARHDYAPTARRLIRNVLVLGLLAVGGYWAWHQPFMAYPRAVMEISQMPAPTALPVPVRGVPTAAIADTYGAPRGAKISTPSCRRSWPRGTPVVSTTRGVVSSLRETGLGGKQVWVMGPARERHYYAHLDGWAAGLEDGDLVWPGDELGIVGDTGNARGTPPHLHYGIYGDGGALNPLPRLQANADQTAVSAGGAER